MAQNGTAVDHSPVAILILYVVVALVLFVSPQDREVLVGVVPVDAGLVLDLPDASWNNAFLRVCGEHVLGLLKDPPPTVDLSFDRHQVAIVERFGEFLGLQQV
jgi:hypothetical protein